VCPSSCAFPELSTLSGMLTVVLSISVAALSAALIALLWRVMGVVSPTIARPEPVTDWSNIREGISLQTARIDANERAIADLLLAVDEGIKRVDRAENRVQKTVTSARRLIREAGLEHAGIEAEFAELHPSDGEGIEPLPPMPELVEDARTIRIPGGNLTLGVG